MSVEYGTGRLGVGGSNPLAPTNLPRETKYEIGNLRRHLRVRTKHANRGLDRKRSAAAENTPE
jgi:hypothetical protein